MTIHRTEITAIPQTEEGRKFANEYADRLRKQNVLDCMTETTTAIKIQATYHFTIKRGESE